MGKGAGPRGLPLVFDGHNDALLKLTLPKPGEERGFFERSDIGHLDLPRAREGGLGGDFFACWVPNPEDEWTVESALSLTVDGYEVAEAPRAEALRRSRYGSGSIFPGETSLCS